MNNASHQNVLKNNAKIMYLLPSAVSVIRVVFAVLLVVIVVDSSLGVLITAVLGVPFVMLLDAFDGMLARRYNAQTLLGSFIDIAADRLVEFIFLQYFVSANLVPLWFILIFYFRIVLTDACRIRAFSMEQIKASGIVLPKPLQFFVLSKLSRSVYGTLKGVFFSLLFLIIYQGKYSISLLEFTIMLSVLAFSLLRGIPVLITYLPRRKRININDSKSHPPSRAKDIATLTTKATSWMQLASDVCLAIILIIIALR